MFSDKTKPNTTAASSQVAIPETSTDCLEAALDHLAKLRSALDAAADRTQSAANARRLRALSCGLLVLRSPLALIAGYSDEARL
jgi:hypothetical protein